MILCALNGVISTEKEKKIIDKKHFFYCIQFSIRILLINKALSPKLKAQNIKKVQAAVVLKVLLLKAW